MDNEDTNESTPLVNKIENIESLKDSLSRRVQSLLNEINEKRKRDDHLLRDFVLALEALVGKTIKHAEDTIFEKYNQHKQNVEQSTQTLYASLDSIKNLLGKMNKVLFSLCSYTQLSAEESTKGDEMQNASKSALSNEAETPLTVTVNIITEKHVQLTAYADKFTDGIMQKRSRDMMLMEEFMKLMDSMVQKYCKMLEDLMFKIYGRQNAYVEGALRQIYVSIEQIDRCKDTLIDTQLKLKEYLG